MPDIITAEDNLTLIHAFERLEHPSYAIRLCNVIGTPLSMAFKLLPHGWYRRLQGVAEACIVKALHLSITHVMPAQSAPGNARRHTLLSVVSGAVGGFLGGPAMLLEMPVSTSLMLSAIADIARTEGEDINNVETRIACLTVFALGGRSDEDDAADIGYYGLRMALEAPVAEALRYLSQAPRVVPGKAPALVGFVQLVAKRFGVVLSEKALIEMMPVFGAAGGALSNKIFMQHFQDMARCHFAIRRLERKYGPESVRNAYQLIKYRESVRVPQYRSRRPQALIPAVA